MEENIGNKEEKKEQYEMSSLRAIRLSGKEMALAETLINVGLAKDFSDLVKKGLYFMSNLSNQKDQKGLKNIEKKFLEEQVDLIEKGEDEKANLKWIEHEMHFEDREKAREMLHDKMLFMIFKAVCKSKEKKDG